MMIWFIDNLKNDLKIIKALRQMDIEVSQVSGKSYEFNVCFKGEYGCVKSVRVTKWHYICNCVFNGDFSHLNGKTSLLSMWLEVKCDSEVSKYIKILKKKKKTEDKNKHQELKNKVLRIG